MKPKFIFFSIVLLLGMMPYIQAVQGQMAIYTSSLSGPAEAPPNASPGIGTVTVTINTVANTMRVQSSFSGLTGNTTAVHIHAATAEANTGTAGVATQTPYFLGFPIGVSSGVYDATFDMTLASSYRAGYITASGGTPASAFAALKAALEDQKAYFNIHSTAFTGGEIRGFLRRTWYLDRDNDSYGNPDPAYMKIQATKPVGYVDNNLDCKDWDNTIYPGAAEQEDGKDNDCDGEVDEGLACRQIWYFDGDKDGFGRNVTTRWSCTKPNNYVKDGGDCNDHDASIFPDAPEQEDGKDNNCDGQVDEGKDCRKLWYVDRDGDGYGDSYISLTKWSCVKPAGYANNATDCHSHDASVYPGAPEICDGKDNDCNGKIDDNCVPPGITGSKMPENNAKLLAKAEGMALEVRLWPNPARNVLMVSLNNFEAGKKLEIALLQADGRVVASHSLIPAVKGQQMQFDVRAMSGGFYLLQVKQGTQSMTKRVIVAK